MGDDAAPVLLISHYDKLALRYVFIFTPLAYDPDGNNLTYRMTRSPYRVQV